jgi:hypothetical protein
LKLTIIYYRILSKVKRDVSVSDIVLFRSLV